MKYYKLIIFIFFINIGCKDSMEIPDTGRKIVINGLITNDSLINVRIGTSSYILDINGKTLNDQQDLKNAEVKIFRNQNYTDSLEHFLYGYSDIYDTWWVFVPGNYKSRQSVAQPGSEYLIKVKASWFPEATAITNIPEIVEIENVDTFRVILAPGEFVSLNTGIKCKIRFTDPLSVTNYYLLTVKKVPTVSKFYNNIEINSKDPIVEELLHSRYNEGIAFSDKVINGQTYELSLVIRNEDIAKVQTYEEDYSLHFILYSITEEYFKFIKALNRYSKNFGNPLADPVMMFSNVNGGFGMFTGAAVSSVSIKYSFK